MRENKITLINILEYFKRDNKDITNIKPNTKVVNYLNISEKFDAFIDVALSSMHHGRDAEPQLVVVTKHIVVPEFL